MYRILFALILLSCVECRAENNFVEQTTMYEPIPGSYRIEFGGIWDIAHEEGMRYIERSWRDLEWLRFKEGAITFEEMSHRQNNITLSMSEWSGGEPWWYRHWWHSRKEEDGGAPQEPVILAYGNTFKIIDNDLFSLTNSGDFELKGFEAAFSSEDISYGVRVTQPRTGWKVRLKPDIAFSSSQFLLDPTRAIRRLGARLTATHSVHGVDIVAINIRARWRFSRHDGIIEIQLSFLQW